MNLRFCSVKSCFFEFLCPTAKSIHLDISYGPRILYGEAVFNIELSKPAGVFLLWGLEVATLGDGVFLKDAHPTYHAALFEELTRTLRRLHMQHQAVTS